MLFIAAALSSRASAPVSAQDSAWRLLFNGRDLAGWTPYTGPLHPQFDSMRRDSERAFGIVRIDGEPALRVDGALWGALTSDEEFADFHLRLEYRWGANQWPPLRFFDSGVMDHAGVPLDAVAGGRGRLAAEEGRPGYFRESMEYQIAGHQVGIFAPLGRITADEVEALPFLERRRPSWNRVDLLAVGDEATHLLNGHLVRRMARARYLGAGEPRPLTRGRLQLQSEGTETSSRRIEICPIEDLDAELAGLRAELQEPAAAVRRLGSEWTPLFDGHSFAGWSPHAGPPPSAMGEVYVDPRYLFRIVEVDGEPAIRVGGTRPGVLATDDAFENDHLQLEVRLGENLWPTHRERRTAVDFHAFGAAGLVSHRSPNLETPGPLRHETGWGGASRPSLAAVLSEDGSLRARSYGPVIATAAGAGGGAAEPAGGWHRIEIQCVGDRAEGQLGDRPPVELRDLLRVGPDGRLSHGRGRIELHSAGAEAYFRRIEVRALESLGG